MADTTTLNKSVSALSNLEHFYSRRRTASVTIVAYTIQQSFLLGSSVVASALLRFYTPGTIDEHPFFPRDNQTYAFNGLYALALVLFVSYVLVRSLSSLLLENIQHQRRLLQRSLSPLYLYRFFLAE